MYEVETDSAMGVKVLGLNVRIGGRDVVITIEEARILERNLHEALHSPIDTEVLGDAFLSDEEDESAEELLLELEEDSWTTPFYPPPLSPPYPAVPASDCMDVKFDSFSSYK